MKKIFFLLAAASVMFAACTPEEQKEELKKATVSVEAGDVTTSSVTFTVTSENATAVAYVCVEGSTPTGEAILENGAAVEVNTTATVTVKDLTDGATYTIVAAAMNDLGIVVSEPVTMTTTDVPAEPQVTITEVEATDASFTFVVTPTDATKCAYKVYDAGAEAVAGDILAEGTEVSATEEQEVTISGLEDGEYFVVAAVQNGTTTAMSEQLSFTISTLEELVINEFNYATAYIDANKIRVKFVYDDPRGNSGDYIQVTFNTSELLDGTYSIAENTIDNTQEYEEWYGETRIEAVTANLYSSYWDTEYGRELYQDMYIFSSLSVTVAQNNGVYTVSGTGVQYNAYWEHYFDAKDNKKLVFEYQGTIDGLSPEQPEEPTYTIASERVIKPSYLEDGKTYVVFNQYYNDECWTVVDGKLTMTTVEGDTYPAACVFQYKEDDTYLDKTIDDYWSWGSCYWQSVATGKYIGVESELEAGETYLDAEVNATSDLENALFFMCANDWGGYGGGEIDAIDVYVYPSYKGNTMTMIYHNDVFNFGPNGLYNDDPVGSKQKKRKWLIYEATLVE